MCLSSFISSVILTIVLLKDVCGIKSESKCGNAGKPKNRRISHSLDCHDQVVEEDLPSADARNFTFPDKSIFFIQTACDGGLDLRQTCAVESAAKVHPGRPVNVLFAGPVAPICTHSRPLNSLLIYKNVKFFRIHRKAFSKDTPLESFIASNILDTKSRYPVHHSSEVLKLLTLYRFGGIYLDLDVLVLKPLDTLPQSRNWVVKESVSFIGSAMMALSKDEMGKKFASEAVEILRDEFNPMGWSDNGNGVLTKAYHRLCSNNTKACEGFKVYDQSYFFPLESWQYRNFFRRNMVNMTNAYTIQMWHNGQDQTDDSSYDKIAELYCPRTHKLMGNVKSYMFTYVSRTKADILYGSIVINEKDVIEKRKHARPKMRGPLAAPKATIPRSDSIKVVFGRRGTRDGLRRLGTRFLFFSNGSHRNGLQDRSHMPTYNDVKLKL